MARLFAVTTLAFTLTLSWGIEAKLADACGVKMVIKPRMKRSSKSKKATVAQSRKVPRKLRHTQVRPKPIRAKKARPAKSLRTKNTKTRAPVRKVTRKRTP